MTILSTLLIATLFAPGIKELDATLEVSPSDGGKVFASSDPAKPAVLSGGRTVTGWRVGTDGVWRVTLPEVKSGKWNFSQLFVNGERRKRPCVPADGFYLTAGNAYTNEPGMPCCGFVYNPKGVTLRDDYANVNDIEVEVFYNWSVAKMRLAGIDLGSNRVRFTSGRKLSGFHSSHAKPRRWHLENVKEAFGRAGEWYLDRPTGVLSYKPFPGGRWFECTVKDSTFSRLSQSNVWERCHYVNTKFDKCQRGDFALKDCDFTGCEFRGLGSAYLRMTGCKLTDTSVEGGYWEKPARCLFRDCTIKTRDDTALLKLGVYTIGRIGIDGCTVTGNGPLIDVFDLRPISLPPNAAENPDLTSGAIAVRNTTYKGTAKALIVHEKPGHVSSKKILVLDKGKNNLAPGVDFVEYPPSTWSRK